MSNLVLLRRLTILTIGEIVLKHQRPKLKPQKSRFNLQRKMILIIGEVIPRQQLRVKLNLRILVNNLLRKRLFLKLFF